MLEWMVWGGIVAAKILIIAIAHMASTPLAIRFVAGALVFTSLANIVTSLYLVVPWWQLVLLMYGNAFVIFIAIVHLRETRRFSGRTLLGMVSFLLLVASLSLTSERLLLWSALMAAGVILTVSALQLRVSLARYRLRQPLAKPTMPLADLPTVSVCVPARNETFALASCLDSILASNYPKIEIIVLDDCSQDSTSQLIKSYAHAGVRFVAGSPPPEGWLGRNHACQVLAQEASGAFILYVDVDTRLERQTISQLVDYALLKRVSMVSVLPERRDLLRASILFAPLRYFWQMITPQFIQTPASSALWLVRRKKLLEQQGFMRIKGDVTPENTLARTFDLAGKYRFLISDSSIGAFYAKKWASQLETSIRLGYPSLGKSPALTLFASVALLGVFMVPFYATVYGLAIQHFRVSFWVALVLILVSVAVYIAYARALWRHNWLFAALAFPYTLTQEVVLIVASMVGYELQLIHWRGRNICYPVLRRSR